MGNDVVGLCKKDITRIAGFEDSLPIPAKEMHLALPSRLPVVQNIYSQLASRCNALSPQKPYNTPWRCRGTTFSPFPSLSSRSPPSFWGGPTTKNRMVPDRSTSIMEIFWKQSSRKERWTVPMDYLSKATATTIGEASRTPSRAEREC